MNSNAERHLLNELEVRLNLRTGDRPGSKSLERLYLGEMFGI